MLSVKKGESKKFSYRGLMEQSNSAKLLIECIKNGINL